MILYYQNLLKFNEENILESFDCLFGILVNILYLCYDATLAIYE